MTLKDWLKPPSRTEGAQSRSRAAQQTISLCRQLMSERSEVSGVRLAEEAVHAYQALDPSARSLFFDLLIKDFSPNPVAVGEAGDIYRNDPSPANLARLLRVVEPPRQELFRRLNLAPDATRTILDMRKDLLQAAAANPQWAPVEADLAHLLGSWFNRGFLILKRIDWRTSAIVLEKLINYEAVHEIQGWEDLRRRLESDRRCYAFFHPALPDEPIIFIEVALTRGMSASVQPLIDPAAPVIDPASANCAVFYSITNCQEGLRGVPFGSFLIKQVAEDLGREFPRIHKFATLSPVPGFMNWLNLVTSSNKTGPVGEKLLAIGSKLETPEWFRDKALAADLQRLLVPLCAYYLLYAIHKKEPLDPVARFHLRNGAQIERLNWLGDTAPGSLQRSLGLMVNYIYRLDHLEANHDRYTKEFRITASSEIERLAKQSVLRDRNSAHTLKEAADPADSAKAS